MSQDNMPPEATPTSRLPDVVRHEIDDRRPRGLLIGPLFGVVFALGAVVALVASFLSGDPEPVRSVAEASDPSTQLVSLSITRLAHDGVPRAATIAATVTAAPNRGDYGWITPGDTVVGQPAIRPSDANGQTMFAWLPGGEIELGVWSSNVSVADVVDASVLDVAAECELEREGVVGGHGVSVELSPDRSSDSGESVARYTFLNSALRAGDRIECTFTDVTVDDQ